MKKILVAVFVFLSVFLSVAKADPSGGVVAVVAATSFVVGKYSPQLLALNVNANLTDACKSKTVQAKGGTYSYSTFEGCLDK